MLRINSIKNVNNTLNNLSFTSGVRTNYGIEAPKTQNMVEGSLFTGFAGVVEKSRQIFSPKIAQRAKSIKNGLEETKKLNTIA